MPVVNTDGDWVLYCDSCGWWRYPTDSELKDMIKGDHYCNLPTREQAVQTATLPFPLSTSEVCKGCAAAIAQAAREEVLEHLEELSSPSVSDARKREIVEFLRSGGK